MSTATTILLVDDDTDDHYFFDSAVRGIKNPTINLVSVYNGKEALDHLKRGGKPDLIVLDLNMPILNGQQVLSTLKSANDWQHIPVFIFTTSTQKSDEVACRLLGCTDFYTKPMSTRGYGGIVQDILRKAKVTDEVD